MISKIDPIAGDGTTDQGSTMLAAHRQRQRATRTALLAQANGAEMAPGTRLAPGDGAFNAAAAAVLTQWKDQ